MTRYRRFSLIIRWAAHGSIAACICTILFTISVGVIVSTEPLTALSRVPSAIAENAVPMILGLLTVAAWSVISIALWTSLERLIPSIERSWLVLATGFVLLFCAVGLIPLLLIQDWFDQEAVSAISLFGPLLIAFATLAPRFLFSSLYPGSLSSA